MDNNIGLDIDISVKCFGEYSYKIVDPVLFYTNVCGNVSDQYEREEIDSQLKSEVLTALQPAFAQISAKGVRYSEVPGHTNEIADALNEILSKKWSEHRGISIVSFGVSSIKADEEDEKMIKEAQRNAINRNPNMAAATLVGAQAQAMQDAAKNEGAGSAMFGFAGMNMAANAGGMNAGQLFQMGAAQGAAPAPAPQAGGAAPQAGGWTCPQCNTQNTGKFCTNCGTPAPAPAPAAGAWFCPDCGTKNEGKFCTNCGHQKP